MGFTVIFRKDTSKPLITEDLQSYIDDCSANGGGNIVFNKGEYVLSTVFLKSNVNIVLEEGAVLLGAPSFYDYCFHEKIDYPLYQDESHSFFHCSMFVGIDCENISITGKGKIDMRSVWDEDNVRNIVHRGAKCIALKECKNIAIKGVTVNNCTDLAIYFAGCENVEISGIKMRTYIDGISPDNSKNVKIYDCDIETGDDGIVFKSSFTLNRIDYCKNIRVWNCKIKSRCNAIKFGTETNGGFDNIDVRDIRINDTRLCGICLCAASRLAMASALRLWTVQTATKTSAAISGSFFESFYYSVVYISGRQDESAGRHSCRQNKRYRDRKRYGGRSLRSVRNNTHELLVVHCKKRDTVPVDGSFEFHAGRDRKKQG